MSIQIVGTYMDRSIRDFVLACTVYIEVEQQKLAPDHVLIALLCDAIRLTREMETMHKVCPQQVPQGATNCSLGR